MTSGCKTLREELSNQFFFNSLDEHIKEEFDKNNTDTSKEQYTDACTSIQPKILAPRTGLYGIHDTLYRNIYN